MAKSIKLPNWKKWMKEYQQLVKAADGSSYDRAILLMKIYKDVEFQAAMKAEGKDPEDEMNTILGEMCVSCFAELVLLHDRYPHRDQWEGGLKLLVHKFKEEKLAEQKAKKEQQQKQPAFADVFQIQDGDEDGDDTLVTGGLGVKVHPVVPPQPEPPKVTGSQRLRATLKEVEDLKAENEHLRTELRYANQQIEVLTHQNEQLAITISTLREVIATVKLGGTPA